MLIQRMIRAARLEAALYEEVEADKTTMRQAMLVVAISSIAAGIGNFPAGGIQGLVALTIGALIGWFIWALLTYLIGTKLLKTPQTEADLGQLLRTIGFSASPGVIRILAIISPLAVLVNLVAAIWMFVAMIVAVRQALDYTSTFRAVAVVFIGWIIQLGLLMFLVRLGQGA